MAAELSRPRMPLVHDGETWLAMLTGGSTSGEGCCIGVLFVAETTGREVFGRLRGIPSDHFEQATGDQLRMALIAALSGDDD